MKAQELYGYNMDSEIYKAFNALWDEGVSSQRFGKLRRAVASLGIEAPPAPIFTYDIWEDREQLVRWCDILFLGTKSHQNFVLEMTI